jgi:fumarate hydratase subunit alpha
MPSLEEFKEIIAKAVSETIERAVIYIPPDIKQALKRAYEEEVNPMAKSQLEAILKNIELAEKFKKPVCQDTGSIIYYVTVGYDFPGLRVLREALVEAVRRATKQVPLRPNTVDPFTGRNPGDNTGRYMPYIHLELVEGDGLEVTVVPKGGGSEGVSYLELPPPGEGVKAVKRVVVDAVLKAGSLPCPPTIVGVGVGGGADIAMYLAKKAACTRKIGTLNPDPVLYELEKELYEALNSLGIGPMGLGGKYTVLAVHVDYAHRHPAAMPVAVAFQCWATRRATVKINANGKYVIEQ